MHKPTTKLPITDSTESSSESSLLPEIHPYHDKISEQYRKEKALSFKDAIPTIPFSIPLANLILQKIFEGKRLSQVANMDGMPNIRTIYSWLRTNQEFALEYEEALKVKGLYAFDAIEEIADLARYAHKDEVPGLKTSLDAYKFIAERSDRSRYGPPTSSQGSSGVTIQINTGVSSDPDTKDTRTYEEVIRDLRKQNIVDATFTDPEDTDE